VDLTPEVSGGGLVIRFLGFVGNFKLDCPQCQYGNGLAVELDSVGISTNPLKLLINPGDNIPNVFTNEWSG